jgi:hypothetical protein
MLWELVMCGIGFVIGRWGCILIRGGQFLYLRVRLSGLSSRVGGLLG